MATGRFHYPEFSLGPPGLVSHHRPQTLRWQAVCGCAPPGPVLGPRAKLLFQDKFGAVDEIAQLPRKRGPLTIEIYAVTLLSNPKGDVLDRTPPPELLR